MVKKALLAAVLVLALPGAAAAKPWRAVMAPGDVGKSHADTEDKCDRCHLPFKGIPDEKCLDCHAAILARVKEKRGFHGAAAASKQACISCHTDHRGRNVSLTKDAAKKAFTHADTGFALEGKHAQLGCERCHNVPLEKMSAASCGGCHKDPHQGELGKACRTCHASSEAWKAGIKAREEHHLRMDAGHGKLACKDCHAKGEHLEPKVACASCHEAQHGDTKAACDVCHSVEGFAPAKHDHSVCTCKFPGKHITFDCLGCHAGWKFTNTPTLCSGCHEKIRKHEPLGECSLCHSPFSWKKKDQFDHNKRSTFKLEGEHLRVDCARCHTVSGQFRGAPKACEGCHAKDGEEAHGDFGACARCHTTEGFEKPTFDHASTGFPLTGRHAKLNCQDCHTSKVSKKKRAAVEAARVEVLLASADGAPMIAADVHGGEQACSHCHEDPHRGSAKGECSACHATEAWKPPAFARERHAETKFPLRGKHLEVACAKCHVGAQIAGVPQQCGGCHFDPHRGRLGGECATCHSESGFKPVSGFDHAKTGYALVGPHQRAMCDGCHAGARGEALAKVMEQATANAGAAGSGAAGSGAAGSGAAGSGASIAVGVAAAVTAQSPAPPCTTCHALGHGAELGSDCTRCHALAADSPEHPQTFASARGLRFPEHTKTGFTIDRRHLVLPCKSCHPASGPAPSNRCASCHLDPHSGQLGQSCEDCHRADRFRLARFDHDRAGWPLRGRHFVTPCATCHTSQRWVGLTTECWDCHARDAAIGRSMRPDKHGFGPLDCRGCHSFWTWRGASG